MAANVLIVEEAGALASDNRCVGLSRALYAHAYTRYLLERGQLSRALRRDYVELRECMRVCSCVCVSASALPQKTHAQKWRVYVSPEMGKEEHTAMPHMLVSLCTCESEHTRQ